MNSFLCCFTLQAASSPGTGLACTPFLHSMLLSFCLSPSTFLAPFPVFPSHFLCSFLRFTPVPVCHLVGDSLLLGCHLVLLGERAPTFRMVLMLFFRSHALFLDHLTLEEDGSAMLRNAGIQSSDKTASRL